LSVPDLKERLKIKKDDLCPYHYSIYIANKVDLLLCPYNYILDPLIRKIMKIDISNAIIIFDEAHNVEEFSENCYSYEVSNENIKFLKNIKGNNFKL
jgi:Rad3-related DNA helicase